MFNPYEASGLRCVGQYTDPRVNNGQPVPVFEPVDPEGRPSINTLEGWNKYVAERNRRSFISANGREPENDAELSAWVDRMCREAAIRTTGDQRRKNNDT